MSINANLTKARFFEERARKHQKDEARRARYARAAERYRLAGKLAGELIGGNRSAPVVRSEPRTIGTHKSLSR
jgi:hypothetical protein